MYLKPAGIPNTFDVFLGVGWDNWSRVQVREDGTVVPIKGISLNSHFRQHVQNIVSSLFYSDLRSKRRK
jgi:hypothetical protein